MWVKRFSVLAATVAIALSASAVGAAEKEPPGDPPGNNGTVKVVADEKSDPDPGNEPHIDGCLLWLEFYNFDQDQTAEIVFSAHPPTGDKVLLTHQATISDDPAGGGQDRDAVLGFNLASALGEFTPHPQQGYHVKVTSNSDGAPGGPKQKVFWLNCPAAPPGSLTVTKAAEGTPAGGPFSFALACNHAILDQTFTLNAGESKTFADVPAGTTCQVTETADGEATETKLTEVPADDAADGKVKVPGEGKAEVTFTNVFADADTPASPAGQSSPPVQPATIAGQQAPAGQPAPAAGPGTSTLVAGVTETNDASPSALPRTGAEPWRLVAVAALLMLAGSAFGLAGRRRLARA